MEYRSVFLANPAQLSVRNQQLVIRQGQEVSSPMEDISGLLIESQQVTITSAAMQKLTEYGVTVYFCDEKHLPAALLLPMNRHSRQLKQNLFDLTNFLVSQNQKHYRSITAIGRSVESFVRVIQKKEKTLELLTLIPLKKYHYE